MEFMDLILVPLVVGVVEIAKYYNLKTNLLPLCAIATSIVLGLVGGIDLTTAIIMGLTASGTYDVVKHSYSHIKK